MAVSAPFDVSSSHIDSYIVQVGLLREVSNKPHNAELKLFLEVESGLVKTFSVILWNDFLFNFWPRHLFKIYSGAWVMMTFLVSGFASNSSS